MEIIETGNLRRIAYERTPDVAAMKIFMGIYDVGMSGTWLARLCTSRLINAVGKATAHQWFVSGCRTLEDVKAGKGGIELHSAQKIGLQYYDGNHVRVQEVPLVSKFSLQISMIVCREMKHELYTKWFSRLVSNCLIILSIP